MAVTTGIYDRCEHAGVELPPLTYRPTRPGEGVGAWSQPNIGWPVPGAKEPVHKLTAA